MTFCFGANRLGIHGAGAAKFARQHRGAILGQGEGLQGTSYAIPTKATPYVTLPLEEIAVHVRRFIEFAHVNATMQFQVTAIGCGRAGYRPAQIGPLFAAAPSNCVLCPEFEPFRQLPVAAPSVAMAAKSLAERAHSGQVDKAGRPYIEHLARVAARLEGDDVAQAAGWLHDLVEDQPHHAAELDQFPARVGAVVRLLTRTEVGSGAYYAQIGQDPLALRVKLADIADNCDERRLEALPVAVADRLRRKYSRARAALLAESEGCPAR